MPDVQTTAPPIIREKLADKGLIETQQKHTCQELWDTYLAEKYRRQGIHARNIRQGTRVFFLVL